MLPPNQIRLTELLLAARHSSDRTRQLTDWLLAAGYDSLAACAEHWVVSGPVFCRLGLLAGESASKKVDDIDFKVCLAFWKRHDAA